VASRGARTAAALSALAALAIVLDASLRAPLREQAVLLHRHLRQRLGTS
jgi:hypothetical protein